MNPIRALPDELINKIKAGEMIERPANVLKELLENAIDAQAARITVSLEKGGIDAIVVSDNGHGIAADDVPLAIKRHTTSKISRAEDLWALHSLGFRGEALASIAEVSRFTLSSATAAEKTGARLNSAGEVSAWSGAVGTSVSVQDIFYNVPARRKFLKNAATEYAHCHTCVQALALAHPHIEFILQHNCREQLRVVASPAASGEEALRARATSLFGAENVAPLLYAEDKNETAQAALLFSPPGHERAHKRHIFTFVNHRWIKSTSLQFAILRGYHSHLLKGRYPLVLAYLQVHPALLDVNVHPMKREVRFQYDKDVQELVALNIRRKLRSPAWSTAPAPFTSSAMPAPQTESKPNHPPPLPTVTRAKSSAVREQRIFYPQATSTLPFEHPADTHAREKKADNTELDWSALRHIGTAARCYLLFEDQRQHLIVVDQHAFHERIIFEQLRSSPQMLARGQKLTIAEALALSAEEVELIRARQEEFARLGFELEVMSANDVLLKGVPALLQAHDYSGALQELLALAQQDNTEWFGESLLHDVVATIACRAAVKAGDVLETARLQQLFSAAQGVDFYHNCPHGRRVLRVFSPRHIGAWFDRI